jgi:hypothetical protein
MASRPTKSPEAPASLDEPDAGAWAHTGHNADLALLVLRNRRRDPCAERIAIELDRRRTPAERATIEQDTADVIAEIFYAVFDGIGLSGEQRERAREIAAVELRKASGEAR